MREQLIRMIEHFRDYEEFLNIDRDKTIEIVAESSPFSSLNTRIFWISPSWSASSYIIYKLTDDIKSGIEIFKEVRDEIEEGRRI